MDIRIVLLAAIQVCHGHMSLYFPKPRDDNGTHVTWQQNEPMIPVYPNVCHGVPPDPTVFPGNTFALGDTIDIVFNVDARHSGGHCAFWYSTDDQTFTKILDVKDCTLADVGAHIQLPDAMPAECGEKCTFAFSWVPLRSGACEIYMSCADIRVVDAVGGESNENTKNFQTEFIDQGPSNQYGCERVSESTHWTTIFMPLVTESSNNGAFEIDQGLDTDDTPVRTMLYVAVFGMAWCLVVAAGVGLKTHCTKRRVAEIEKENMVASVEESHQITELDVEVSVDMEKDRQEETIAITEPRCPPV